MGCYLLSPNDLQVDLEVEDMCHEDHIITVKIQNMHVK